MKVLFTHCANLGSKTFFLSLLLFCLTDIRLQKLNKLGVDNIGGVFVVLLCGLAFAILVAILEFCWNSKKNANNRQSLCSEMAEELRFAIRCHGSRQRPALKRNCVKCSPAGQHTYVPSSFGLPHHFGVIY